MPLDNQTKEQLRRFIGPLPRVSKRRARIVLLGIVFLFGVWLVGAVYFYQQVENDKAQLEQKRMEASRREEAARRQASYQQELERYKKSSRPQSHLYGQ